MRTVLADGGLGAEVGLDAGPGPTLYLSDAENHRVLRLERTGRVTTVAEQSAGLDAPSDVALAPDGSLYVADAGLRRIIWRIWPDGTVQDFAPLPATTLLYASYDLYAQFLLGVLRPFPGGFSDSAAVEAPSPRLAVNQEGGLIATTGLPPLLGISGIPGAGDDDPAAGLEVAVYLYEANIGWRPLLAPPFDRRVAIDWLPDGKILLASGSRDQVAALSANTLSWELLAGAGVDGASGDSGPATASRLRSPQSLAVLSTGEIYVADEARVRIIGTDGVIRASDFSAPGAFLAANAQDNLFLSDAQTVQRRTPGGAVTTVAEAEVCPIEDCGFFYPFGGEENADRIGRIAVGLSGNVWVEELTAFSARLRLVTSDGALSRPELPNRTFPFPGLPSVHAAGVDAGGEVVLPAHGRIYRYEPGQSDWTEIAGSAGFTGDAVHHAIRDEEGNTYFALPGRVLRLTPEGTLNTVADSIGQPEALAFAPDGDLLIADSVAGLVLRLREPSSCDRTVRPQIYSSGVRNSAAGTAGYTRLGVGGGDFSVVAFGLLAVNYGANAAPGMLASVYGVRLGPAEAAGADYRTTMQIPTELARVSATVGGKPAGVLYASEGQLNLVFPFDLPESGQADLILTVDGVDSEPYPLQMGLARPGVFAVLNADGSLNSEDNPAAIGAEVSLLVSGLGRPEGEADALVLSQSALSWPADEISITVASADANAENPAVQPLWARSRPGEIASLAEVRFAVPQGADANPNGALASISRSSVSLGTFRLYVE